MDLGTDDRPFGNDGQVTPAGETPKSGFVDHALGYLAEVGLGLCNAEGHVAAPTEPTLIVPDRLDDRYFF